MPHKRNPILSENLCGLARIVRSFSNVALENVALWHERDISHSSAERMIGPDGCVTLDFMLHRFAGLVEGLVVDTEQMKRNLELTRGIVYSGSLLTALVDAGIPRDEAYKLVQAHALAAWEGGPDLKARVSADQKISAKISADRLGEVFDIKRHMTHVDMILNRAFGQE
jgi:adenylosuccinate lyase